MQERKLVTYFFLGHLIDSAVSYFYLSDNSWKEVGFLQNSPFLELGAMDKIVIAKMGVVAALIGTYALATGLNKPGIKFSTEKAIQVGTVAVWAVQIWNLERNLHCDIIIML
ncbi:hypothetical protein A2614_01295 [Candidatus Woesebacteria bacterium RIFOXYD1_FULL_40_21]|nr:MAG: hypothetical protein A2614_01295 [Candidatus Woesebacteria bacterium RIFOXYD1_FULL_40_21]